MKILEAYLAAVSLGDIKKDSEQLKAISLLDEIALSLDKVKNSWLAWRKKPQRGAYFYGSVGVGKTYLMDLFYNSISIQTKKRFHFHQFMQQVDKQLREHQGEKDPLKSIGKNLAKSTSLLCFDEVMVDDVAYAMILGELLQTLFDEGVVLVMTSNIPPDNLYLKGVHRERFLPAIAAIKENCTLVHFQNAHDYRLDFENFTNRYFYPLSSASLEEMQSYFKELTAKVEVRVNEKITIQKREIPTLFYTQFLVWFDFKIICNSPRSQLDYLELAQLFDTIFISKIPILTENDTRFAILFIHFVDVMYDQGVRLVLQAEAPVEQLYLKGELTEDFTRTASRLKEMQSTSYLVRHPHRSREEF